MSPCVIDASIITKLVFVEPGSTQARHEIGNLSTTRAPLHVPDLLFAELVSIGLKKIRLDQATKREARGLVDVAFNLPLAVWPGQLMAAAALELSTLIGTSAYDSMYLAVTEHVDGTLITADGKLARIVRGTPLEKRVTCLTGS